VGHVTPDDTFLQTDGNYKVSASSFVGCLLLKVSSITGADPVYAKLRFRKAEDRFGCPCA
jgi:hypothetical protein